MKSGDGKNFGVTFEIGELKRFSIVCGLFGSNFLKKLNRITFTVKTLILQLLIIAYYVNIYIYIYKTVLFFLS